VNVVYDIMISETPCPANFEFEFSAEIMIVFLY